MTAAAWTRERTADVWIGLTDTHARTARRARVLTAVLLALAALSTPAEACSCVAPAVPCSSTWHADAVFRGRVVDMIRVPREVVQTAGQSFTTYEFRVTFAVHELLHGALPERTPQARSSADEGRPAEAASASNERRAPATVGEANIEPGPRVEVTTANDSAACGYAFETGKEYVVYAYGTRVNRPLSTGLCSGNRLVSEAAADLAFLRSVRDQPERAKGRIYGRIGLNDRPFLLGNEGTTYPLPAGVTVRLHDEKDGATRDATPDANGGYSFDGLSTGAYRVELRAPSTLTGWQQPRLLRLPAEQACADASFGLSHNGRLAGRIVNHAGQSVAGVMVGAISADLPASTRWYRTEEAISAADGAFEIDDLPPGRYVVGLNLRQPTSRTQTPERRIFLTVPGARADTPVFAIGKGTRVDIGLFTLPTDFDMVPITGTVVDTEGAALAGAQVYIVDVAAHDAPVAGPAVTDAQGRFTLTAPKGRSYRVSASRYSATDSASTQHAGKSDAFVSTVDLPPFRVMCKGETKPLPF